jgi:ABC-type transport system involved in multi-copper enzyme maturation permease subunit
MTAVPVIVGYVLREALRRRVFSVVLVLTIVFLVLFWVANHYVHDELRTLQVPQDVPVDARTFASAFLTGLALFATMFLGVVLAVFLTLGAVRGDAERGLLQPLVVRPIGRSTFLVARFLGAVAVTAPYVLVVDLLAVVITGLTMHWWPDRIATPPLEVAAAVTVVTAVALLGSVFLSSTANGIAVFMLFGAGLVAGLLGTIGHVIGSSAIKHAATVAAYLTPFEALYQDALRQLTSSTSGLTGFLLQLGPFGGAYVHGWPVRLWSIAFLGLIGAAALAAFARRDL